MSKRKPTKIAKVIGSGNNRSFTLDAMTEARLAYLVNFYREVVGIKTSGSGVVRRAISDLTALAEDLTRHVRVLPNSRDLQGEARQIAQAMQGDKAPWLGSAPELTGAGSFPTFAELCEQHKDTRPPLERILAAAGMPRGRGGKGAGEVEGGGEAKESGESVSSAAAA